MRTLIISLIGLSVVVFSSFASALGMVMGFPQDTMLFLMKLAICGLAIAFFGLIPFFLGLLK